jgi:probable F420-dependent oxidoreductase
MTHERRFRFTLQSFSAGSAAEWRETARRAEALGYSTLHLADHYLGNGPAMVAANHPAQDIASVPALAMAAAVTTTLNIGSRVFCTGYRPAPILIKEAMTLDLLSDGRFELGLGAGWIKSEYEAMGIPFPSPGPRIDRLEETIRLAKASMRGGMLDITGEHVHAVGYEAIPRPPRGHVPLMVGGGGPRVLKLAGREADIVSLNSKHTTGKLGAEPFEAMQDAELHKKIDWVKEGAGDRFDDLELEIGIKAVALADSQMAGVQAMAGFLGITIEELGASPYMLIGSVDSV